MNNGGPIYAFTGRPVLSRHHLTPPRVAIKRKTKQRRKQNETAILLKRSKSGIWTTSRNFPGKIALKLGSIKKSNLLEKEDIMKKLLVVFSVIFLIIAAAGTGILTWRDFRDGSDLAKLETEMDKTSTQTGVGKSIFKEALKQKGLDISASRFTFAGIVTALTFLVCLAVFILVFMKKPDISVYAGIGLIIFTIIMILVNPGYDTGPYGPAPARTLAIIIGAAAILGAICSITLAKKRQKMA